MSSGDKSSSRPVRALKNGRRRPRGEEPPLPEPREEVKSMPPPQPRPPPLRSSLAPLRPVPHPLLLDTLPVFLDLPVLDLGPKSLQHWPQLCSWFPAPLSPSTQTSLGCCQTSLLLPLFAASLPLGDRTSLRQFPGEDLCPVMHPPVPRSTLRSPLLNRWVPLSPVRGPCLAGPGCGPIHPQVRPWKRAEKDIVGLEGYEKTDDASERTSLADQEDGRLIFINQPQFTKFCSNHVSISTAQKRREFAPIRKQLVAVGLRPFLIYPATLKVVCDGQPILFKSPKAAEDFLSSRGDVWNQTSLDNPATMKSSALNSVEFWEDSFEHPTDLQEEIG
ncbi:UNVERIFIED_CONTAM: hypothetical protein FKN15_029513 [Acipenser sinensis]